MIVNRRTFNIKPGRIGEAVALMRGAVASFREATGHTGAIRIYVSSIGKFNQLATEGEYESLAEYEKVMAEWFGSPPPGLMSKWYDVCTDDEGTNEIWTTRD